MSHLWVDPKLSTLILDLIPLLQSYELADHAPMFFKLHISPLPTSRAEEFDLELRLWSTFCHLHFCCASIFYLSAQLCPDVIRASKLHFFVIICEYNTKSTFSYSFCFTCTFTYLLFYVWLIWCKKYIVSSSNKFNKFPLTSLILECFICIFCTQGS